MFPNGQSSPPSLENAVLKRSQMQWMFSTAELRHAPSIRDGMPLSIEQANRAKGVNFIGQVGQLLKLPQVSLATASVYLHRFFMRHSMVDKPGRPGMHHYTVAATALFLATKVEENCRKMKELVVACCRVAQKKPDLIVDEQSKEFWKWRDTILHNEDVLLEALCFDLQLDQPYKILYDLLGYFEVLDNKVMRNASWAFINDSYYTTMCLTYSSKTIAGSALYLAMRHAGVAMKDDEWGRSWWERAAMDPYKLQSACNLIIDFYETSNMPRQGPKEMYTRSIEDEAFAKTRQPATPRHRASPTASLGAESHGTKRDFDEANGTSMTPALSDRQNSGNTRLVDDQNPHSPKRARRDMSEQTHPSSFAGTAADLSMTETGRKDGSSAQGDTGTDVDDVQSRIDAIVNASSSATAPRPAASRQSSQSQQYPTKPPDIRRHSSRSEIARPASEQSFRPTQEGARDSDQLRIKGIAESNNHSTRAPSLRKPPDGAETSHQPLEKANKGVRGSSAQDDRPGSGSEEGEL